MVCFFSQSYNLPGWFRKQRYVSLYPGLCVLLKKIQIYISNIQNPYNPNITVFCIIPNIFHNQPGFWSLRICWLFVLLMQPPSLIFPDRQQRFPSFFRPMPWYWWPRLTGRWKIDWTFHVHIACTKPREVGGPGWAAVTPMGTINGVSHGAPYKWPYKWINRQLGWNFTPISGVMGPLLLTCWGPNL